MSRNARAGSSLVETMVAIVVLAVIALAGAAYLYHARGDIYNARNKRIAQEAASQRLELVRATPYSRVAPTNLTYSIHYLSRQGTNWVHSSSDPGETIQINYRTLPITTTVQYVDADGVAPSSYDYLRLTTSVGYRSGSAERVRLETFYAP